MSLTRSAIEKILLWAAVNEEKDSFSTVFQEMDSYYIDRQSDETYIMEYSIKTIAELKNALIKYSGMSPNSEILKIITTQICQDRYRREWTLTTNDKTDRIEKEAIDGKQQLPDYIYVF